MISELGKTKISKYIQNAERNVIGLHAIHDEKIKIMFLISYIVQQASLIL